VMSGSSYYFVSFLELWRVARVGGGKGGGWLGWGVARVAGGKGGGWRVARVGGGKGGGWQGWGVARVAGGKIYILVHDQIMFWDVSSGKHTIFY